VSLVFFWERTQSSSEDHPHGPGVVVFVTNVSAGIVGGIIQYLEPLKRELPLHGIKVVSLQYPKALNLIESKGLPRLVRAMGHGAFVLVCLARILRLGQRYGTLIVHSHGASYALLTSALAKVFGQVSIHTFHSPVHERSLILEGFAPKVDALVFVSASLHELLSSVSGVRGSETHHLPGAVDLDSFHPVARTEKDQLRASFLQGFGLPDHGILSLFIGRITPEKGVIELVEAASQLRNLGIPMSTVIAGPASNSRSVQSYLEKIEQTIHDRELSKLVHLAGSIDHPDKERLIAAADIFVNSSHWEAAGISVLEALASGVPVVASRVGGLREIVRDGHNGLLVEPGNPKELAEAIGKLARSEGLRRQMGEQARLDAELHFGELKLVNDHLKLYSHIMTHHSRTNRNPFVRLS
jgi:spore coat protein SA